MKQELLGLTAQFWGKAKKLGVKDPSQLMWLSPVRYFDYRSPLKSLSGLKEGDRFYARLLVSRSPVMHDKGRLSLQVTDGKISADVTVFGDTRPFAGLSVNSIIHMNGELGSWNGQLQVKNPQIVRSGQQGRLVPEYLPGESGLNRQTLGSRIAELVEGHSEAATSGLEEAMGEPGPALCKKLKLPFPDFKSLLLALHQPIEIQEAQGAKSALESLSAYASLKLGLDAGARPSYPQAAMPKSVMSVDDLLARLAFKPTGDQSRAINEILADLVQPFPMHRILSGDVGCGKTVAYLIPAVAAQRAGRQVVILMPNTLLAAQVIGELKADFPDCPVASLSAGDRPPENLDSKPVIIGTTAILHWLDKQDPRPDIDLAIIDEQQKLGLDQKRALMGKGTHLLEATATAIPRTQALVRFGVSKVSRIEEMPVVKNIVTHFVDPVDKRQVFDDLVKIVQSGHQIAVLYPRREEEETESGEISRRAVEQAQSLWEKFFPGQVGWIHGGLKSDEKKAMLERMRSGEVRVIITSSVIEIGLTLPDLKALMVVEADRYGASTLHQFRGRVARKGGEGVFYMMSSVPKSELKETSMERLEMLARTTKGIEIAEADLSARGFGELAFSGVSQAGFEDGYLPGIRATPEAVTQVMDLLDVPRKKVRRACAIPAPF